MYGKFINLYEILGIDLKASRSEIKKAFRHLAFQYHPDHNPGNTKATHQFRMISLAYKILINPQKRARYNIIYRKRRKMGNNGNGDGDGRRAIHTPDILQFHSDTILADYFGIDRRESFLNRGMDLCYYLQIKPSLAKMGGKEPIYYSRLLFCERCSGVGMVVNDGDRDCEECDGQGFKEEHRKLVVQIPPGISDGSRLWYRFLGDQNFFGMPPGDLVIVIQVC